jgi:hypothetical protein
MTDTEVDCRRAWHAAALASLAAGDLIERAEHSFQERYCDRPQARIPRRDRYGPSHQERIAREKK